MPGWHKNLSLTLGDLLVLEGSRCPSDRPHLARDIIGLARLQKE